MSALFRALSAAALALVPVSAFAEPTTVTYAMAIAGLPIGSATMVLNPNGSSTSVALSGKAGGPLDIGRMSATAVIGQGQVTVQSQSGSGKDTSSANLVSRGAPGSSAFSYTGETSRGPGKIAMTLVGGRPTALDVSIPDNPKAVRVPVTDAHKNGVIDPLSLLGQVIQPGGMFRPDRVCGANHAVFTGQARFNMAGTPLEPKGPVRGMPEGYEGVGCKVTVTPVSGHRIDKGGNPQPRTAVVTFARSANDGRTLLWSLSVPATFGSFSLTASAMK